MRRSPEVAQNFLLRELLDRVWSDRREEVNKVAVGIPKKQRAVAPGHRRRFLDDAGQSVPQTEELCVNVLDEELENDTAVRLGLKLILCVEGTERPCASNGNSAAYSRKLSEVWRIARRRDTADSLVKADKTLYIVRDDAHRNQIHHILQLALSQHLKI